MNMSKVYCDMKKYFNYTSKSVYYYASCQINLFAFDNSGEPMLPQMLVLIEKAFTFAQFIAEINVSL